MTDDVRLITQNAAASAEEYDPALYSSAEDMYRDIYEDIRGKMTLADFVKATGEIYSAGWWSKYERKQLPNGLTWKAKQALRLLVGLAPLPPTVDDVLGEVDENAQIWRAGPEDAPVDAVIMLAGDEKEIARQVQSLVTPVNRAPLHDTPIMDESSTMSQEEAQRPNYTGYKANCTPPRRKDYRPRIPTELRDEIETDGRSILDIIRAGLAARE